MRAFIAIDLPIEIKKALLKTQQKLKTESLKASWVKPENLHLTLKFLGEISFEQLNEIKQIIRDITKSTSGFKIKLESLGAFPNLHAAQIIWIVTKQPPLELKQIAQQLETRISETGIPQEQRAFSAHITIARIKNQLNSSDLKKTLDKVGSDVEKANWEFDCKEITLFESTLSSEGPTYTALDQFNLKIT